jgi:CRISPR/Cas system CSM-associated protein Csm2 small subunit
MNTIETTKLRNVLRSISTMNTNVNAWTEKRKNRWTSINIEEYMMNHVLPYSLIVGDASTL